MTGANERELVIAGMRAAARDIAPVDIARLARILAIPVDAIPVDLAIAQSREVQAGSSAVEASAALIAGSADPAYWTRELLCRGDLAPDVIAIGVSICARSFPDHPLALRSTDQIRFTGTIFDLHLFDDGIGSLDLGAVSEDGDRLILLDSIDPLASWILMERRPLVDKAGAVFLPFTTRASSGRFQVLLAQRGAGDPNPTYVGAAVAIVGYSDKRPDGRG